MMLTNDGRTFSEGARDALIFDCHSASEENESERDAGKGAK